MNSVNILVKTISFQCAVFWAIVTVICIVTGVPGSLFLDGGINVADQVFGEVLFRDRAELLHVWTHLPRHPLQVMTRLMSFYFRFSLSTLTLTICCHSPMWLLIHF